MHVRGPPMLAPLIPWPVFFKALQRQRSTLFQAWLRYWIFSDDGAALIPRRGDGTAESLSLEERQKIATLFLTRQEQKNGQKPFTEKAKLDATGTRTQGHQPHGNWDFSCDASLCAAHLAQERVERRCAGSGCVSIRFGHHWFMHGRCPHGRVFSGAEDGSTAHQRATTRHRNRFATCQGDNMNLRELLGFNLFLQLFDGTASYFILSRGEAELNPFVECRY